MNPLLFLLIMAVAGLAVGYALAELFDWLIYRWEK